MQVVRYQTCSVTLRFQIRPELEYFQHTCQAHTAREKRRACEETPAHSLANCPIREPPIRYCGRSAICGTYTYTRCLVMYYSDTYSYSNTRYSKSGQNVFFSDLAHKEQINCSYIYISSSSQTSPRYFWLPAGTSTNILPTSYLHVPCHLQLVHFIRSRASLPAGGQTTGCYIDTMYVSHIQTS